MSDEVRRAVVERVKSPLNINLSILYPDAAIHFLKCPSHSVIRLEPTADRERDRCRTAGARSNERARPDLRSGGSSPLYGGSCGQSARDPLAPPRVSTGRSQHAARRRGPLARRQVSPPRHGWSGAFTVPSDPGFRSAVHDPRPVARARRETDSHAAQPPRARRPASSSARAGVGPGTVLRVLPPEPTY